jgi:hypothetical protein
MVNTFDKVNHLGYSLAGTLRFAIASSASSME